MKTTRHALAVAHNALTLLCPDDTVETFAEFLANDESTELEGMTAEDVKVGAGLVIVKLLAHRGEDIEVALPMIAIELAEQCAAEGEIGLECAKATREEIAVCFAIDPESIRKTIVKVDGLDRGAFIDYPTEIVEDNREDFEDRMIDVADGVITVELIGNMTWWVAFAEETAAVVKLTEEAFGDDEDAIIEAFEDDVYSLPIPMQNAAIRRIIAARAN